MGAMASYKITAGALSAVFTALITHAVGVDLVDMAILTAWSFIMGYVLMAILIEASWRMFANEFAERYIRAQLAPYSDEDLREMREFVQKAKNVPEGEKVLMIRIIDEELERRQKEKAKRVEAAVKRENVSVL